MVDKANYGEQSEPLFAKYKCLKLCDIVNLLPVNLQKMFKKLMYVHKYNTRSCTKDNYFQVKFCRTKTRSMAISVKGVKLGNDLKIEYHNIKSLQKLKKLLRKYILMIIINDALECITNLISSNRNELVCMYFSTN